MPWIEDLGYAYLFHRRGGTDLIQLDWDYPAVATSLGWSLARVQRRRGVTMHHKRRCRRDDACEHNFTDGTVDCGDCGVTASEFLAAAGEYMRTCAR